MQYYREEGFASKSSIGYLVKRSLALHLACIEPKLAEHGLSFVQFFVLMSLREGLALTPTDLCSISRHNSGALTRVIDQLEARGLLQRCRSCTDRRSVELRLTVAGSDMAAVLVSLTVETLNMELDGFSAAEVDELIRLLQKLVAKCERYDCNATHR